MNAHAVHVHKSQPTSVLEAARGDFFVVLTRARFDIRLGDEISGDLSMINVRWLFNLRRQTVIGVSIIGRFASMEAAVEATGLRYFRRTESGVSLLRWAESGAAPGGQVPATAHPTRIRASPRPAPEGIPREQQAPGSSKASR